MRKRRNVLTLATAVVAVAIFVLYMITYVVREGEVAVLTTFGKVVRVVEEPGLCWKLPWPIQSEHKFDARLHTDKDRLEETKTSDGIQILVLAYYNWRIAEPEIFYSRLGSTEAARQRLNDLMRDAKDDVFGQHAFSELTPLFHYDKQPASEPDLFEAGRTREVAREPQFRQIEAEVLEKVQAKALDEYGVTITQVGIMRFGLPEETTRLVITRMQEERERVAAGIRERGKGEAAKTRTRADTERQRIVDAATAQATQERTLGDKEAAEYYGIFAKNPELHDFLRKLDALKIIIDETTTLILATDATPFELLREMPRWLLGIGEKDPDTQD